MKKHLTANGRFCAMAAVPPLTILCEIQRYYPAGTAVKPPLRQAAGTLPAILRKCVFSTKKTTDFD